jgi:hypothetical protein
VKGLIDDVMLGNYLVFITGHDYRRTFLHCILPVNVFMLLDNIHDTKRPIKVMLIVRANS